MSKTSVSLELTILELVKNIKSNPSLSIPYNLFEATKDIFPCSEADFDVVLENLLEEELIKATDSWNAGIIRVHGITSKGLDLLRNPEKEAANYNMNINGNITSQNVAFTNQNNGSINMQAFKETQDEIKELFTKVKELPLSSEETEQIVAIENDFETVNEATAQGFKARFATIYKNILLSLAQKHGSSMLDSLILKIQDAF